VIEVIRRGCLPCGWKHLLLTIMSGLITLTAEIPMPDFAIPYAAPMLERIMAMLHPIAPKKDCLICQGLRVCEGGRGSNCINRTNSINSS
jgi:hypothetical protein